MSESIRVGNNANFHSKKWDELVGLFDDVEGECFEILNETEHKVAKDCAKRLRKDSERLFGKGRYSSGWTVWNTGFLHYEVWNKKAYQLTHLLEFGHDMIVFQKGENGAYRKVKVGEVPAYPHIAKVEEMAKRQFDAILDVEIAKVFDKV